MTSKSIFYSFRLNFREENLQFFNPTFIARNILITKQREKSIHDDDVMILSNEINHIVLVEIQRKRKFVKTR